MCLEFQVEGGFLISFETVKVNENDYTEALTLLGKITLRSRFHDLAMKFQDHFVK